MLHLQIIAISVVKAASEQPRQMCTERTHKHPSETYDDKWGTLRCFGLHSQVHYLGQSHIPYLGMDYFDLSQ